MRNSLGVLQLVLKILKIEGRALPNVEKIVIIVPSLDMVLVVPANDCVYFPRKQRGFAEHPYLIRGREQPEFRLCPSAFRVVGVDLEFNLHLLIRDDLPGIFAFGEEGHHERQCVAFQKGALNIRVKSFFLFLSSNLDPIGGEFPFQGGKIIAKPEIGVFF